MAINGLKWLFEFYHDNIKQKVNHMTTLSVYCVVRNRGDFRNLVFANQRGLNIGQVSIQRRVLGTTSTGASFFFSQNVK